jgi:hypothetical protein
MIDFFLKKNASTSRGFVRAFGSGPGSARRFIPAAFGSLGSEPRGGDPEREGPLESGAISLNKPFQLTDLALEVRAVLDA